jgi:hypothetical protein
VDVDRVKGMGEWMWTGLKKWASGCGPGLSGVGQGTVADSHDHHSEYWLSIKCGELSS